MAVSSSSIIPNFNFHRIPLKPEFSFRVSMVTRIGPFATCHDPKKTIAPLRVYSTVAAPDELPERPEDPRWREIHGEDNWAGLLDPIDPALRTELLRYGDMAQACYEAFDSVNGGCKYTKDRLLTGVDLEDCGYDVTRYLYATQGADSCDESELRKKLPSKDYLRSKQSQRRWAGYVAVSNDDRSARMGHRDITIAWHGLDWIHHKDFEVLRKPARIPCYDPNVKIGFGFEQLYTAKDDNCAYCSKSPRKQVLEEIANLVEQHDCKTQPISITLTGHGIGSALAILCAFDVAETGYTLTPKESVVPLTVFSFSGPRVGGIAFKERLEMLGVKVLRIHNVHDVVPSVPGAMINEQSWPWLAKIVPRGLQWSHVGKELALDHTKSPFIKDLNHASSAHSLELLLHLIDGYRGSSDMFKLASKRDIALLNKDDNVLKDMLKIPPYWRRDVNKGSVTKKKGGYWTFT